MGSKRSSILSDVIISLHIYFNTEKPNEMYHLPFLVRHATTFLGLPKCLLSIVDSLMTN